MSGAEAKNLEAISKAIDAHNASCAFPASEVRMNPFEVERLGWEEIRGIPIVADAGIGTGRFRIVCSREGGGEALEETEAIGTPIEVGAPTQEPSRNCVGCRHRQAAGIGRVTGVLRSRPRS